MLNILMHMDLPMMPLQIMRNARREDKVLWSSVSTEGHYTYSRKLFPRYQGKIRASCCKLLNGQFYHLNYG